jgi:DNA adenine methylase
MKSISDKEDCELNRKGTSTGVSLQNDVNAESDQFGILVNSGNSVNRFYGNSSKRGGCGLLPPFAYYGGKRTVSSVVWELFGNVPNYVEPFAGALAVLLGRPHEPNYETVNDKNCFIVNFFRAIKYLPDLLADAASYPPTEADLHARHAWLMGQKEALRLKVLADPFYCDVLIAAWWVYGQCLWVGNDWCINLSNKRPRSNRSGIFNLEIRDDLPEYFRTLGRRLERTRVFCGDFERVLTPAVTTQLGLTGVFLDPPYTSKANRTTDLYAEDDLQVGERAFEWAIEHGEDPNFRIVFCGYENEYKFPESWGCIPWKANGGMANQGNRQGRKNKNRERMWFSPYCILLDKNKDSADSVSRGGIK